MNQGTTALEAFDCPLDGGHLVEASAGTGKTWALCALYLRLLLERGLAVQNILVVTFTNAATAELRDRIRRAITATLQQLRGDAGGSDPLAEGVLRSVRGRGGSDDAQRLLRLELALHSFDEAAIHTIHGFCHRAQAEAAFSAAVPLEMTMLDDDSDIRLDAVHDFWRRRIAGSVLPDALVAYLLERKDSPSKLDALLKRALAKPRSRQIWPEAIDTPLGDAAPLGAAFAAARMLWHSDREAIVDGVLDALPGLSKHRYSAENVQRSRREWDAWLGGGDAAAALPKPHKLALLGSRSLVPNRGGMPPVPHPFHTAADDLLALHEARSQSLALARTALWRDLVEQVPPALRRAKREQRVLAFDDMLFDLHQRLHGEHGAALAAALRGRFAAALIDEFQDTDPLQFEIFSAIYGNSAAPLFQVGDPKQAIYGFRNADLHTYLRARASAAAEATLDSNQRATPELLAAQNALFGANARAFVLPGLHYRAAQFGPKERKPLIDHSQGPGAALQLWVLPTGSDGEPLDRADALPLAVQACAGEIARLLAAARRGEVAIDGRALAAGDIAVLVRSHAQGAAMRHALARLAVGSVDLSRSSVFDSGDAQELERVLAAILEPARLPLLRAALATTLMGRDAAALAAADDALLLDIVERFAGYRDSWRKRGVAPMLRQWQQHESVAQRLLARADGERRMTNLRHLAECLHEAAVLHPSPEALHRWLQAQRREHRHGDALQLRLESDRDLVQVVTIHRSKGLEYPFVFCPTLWDAQPEAPRGGDGVEYHDDDGDAVIDWRHLEAPQQADVRERRALERDAEAVRLIYVALTRAVYRCTLVVGCYRSKHGRNWGTAQSCRSRLNWLVAGAPFTPQQWTKHTLQPAQIDAAWSALALQHAPTIGLAALPSGAGVPLPPAHDAGEVLAALPAPTHIAPAWWIGSYSALVQGVRHEAAAVDHDQRVAAAAAADAAGEAAVEATVEAAGKWAGTAMDADDILRFPRGAVAGECLHEVFERADFGDASHWPAVIDAALQRHSRAWPQAETAAMPLPRMLRRMLHDVLHTALPGGIRLAEVPAGRRMAEMEFHLPAKQLSADALTALLRDSGRESPPLGFAALRGYLRGFVDLVFEHGGRHYIVDWKSNHLGHAPADYAAEALEAVMQSQGYHLQALLYALALHRHLQQRLPHYRHDKHFGGVFYLFVRGVRPGWPGAGVHRQRPELETLQRLSALLGEVQAAR